jgi:hypothetical protein
MEEHSRRKHHSSIYNCFSDAALMVGLTTAIALEDLLGARTNSRKTGPAVEDIRQFLAVFKPDSYDRTAGSLKVVPGPRAARPGLYYVGNLATLVPEVVDSIKQAWVKLPARRRAEFTDQLAGRLDALASHEFNILEAPLDDRALGSYQTLSPRFHILMRDYAGRPFVDRPPNSPGWASAELTEAERAARRLQRTGRLGGVVFALFPYTSSG